MARKIFALLVGAAFLYITSPLIFPILMGAIIAVLFTPILEKMKQRNVGAALGSAFLTAGITLILLLPTSLLIYQGAKSGVAELQSLKGAAENGEVVGWEEALLANDRVHQALEWTTGWLPVRMEELSSTVQDLAHSVALRARDLLTDLLAHLPGLALALSVIVVSLYFFLVDGHKLVRLIRRNSIFTASETDQLIATLAGMCRSVLLASIISGVAQALFFSLACLVGGASNVALIGTLVFIGSFVPIVGSAPVTLMVALQQFLAGRSGVGTGLLIAALTVMAMDNLIRPWFLKGSANLHPLLAFVAAFGGLQTLGPVGIFLGPIVAALFVATVQILVNSPRAAKIQ